ncbi:MAG: DegT/DnrJ/EryC1/StrS aminotransferase [Candidatus Levybacteria bacterium GW2011_GWA2_40_8]|nr:MAG: DegT/DnrJ/EryC1/StrS aminotransferase [Candidatus Levybacteria bacterium GW2011_GWA2_40_8]
MIKLVKSSFYKEEETKRQLTKFINESEKLSFGPQCELFEKNFSKWHKRRHCIFVNSGSSANLSIVQSLLNLGKIKKGDFVGFSAVTWSTNVMPLIELGLNPVPIDVDLETLNISSKNLNKVLEKYPLKMLFLTNLLGFCKDPDKIEAVCKDRKIILVEDNCESLGTIYKRKLLGNFGIASTFSFYVGHHMSTIEGGAICTDSDELSNMLKIVRAHGWDRNLSIKKQERIRTAHNVNETFYSRYTFYDLGYNLRPTEIAGFIGNKQVKYLPEIIKKRRNNFIRLAKSIYKREDLYYPIKFDHIELVSNFAVPLICKSKEIRDFLVEKCKDRVEIRPIVGGNINSQPFFQKYLKDIGKTPNASLIHKQGLYFGNNPDLSEEEIRTLINIFTRVKIGI